MERIRRLIQRRRNSSSGSEGSSILTPATKGMENQRREALQEQFAKLYHIKVHSRDREERPSSGPEEAMENDIPNHPFFEQQQRFDGIDPNVNPLPALNTEADRELKNALNEQKLQHQMKLGLLPKPGTAPKPSGPGQ